MISGDVPTLAYWSTSYTRLCLGHHAVDHVKVGAVDGTSETVVKQVQVYILSLSPPKKEGHSKHAHPKTTTGAVIIR